MPKGKETVHDTLPDPSALLAALDAAGVQLAVIDATRRVAWASRSLVASRGAGLIGSTCRGRLLRRKLDCSGCRLEQVIADRRPHCTWVPETRPGSLGPRLLLFQAPLPGRQLLEVILDTGGPERPFPDQVFRERVLSAGLRHVPAGVVLLDAEMRVVAANPPAVTLLVPPGDDTLEERELALRGRQLDELLPPGVLPARGKDLARLLERRPTIEGIEAVFGEGASRRVFQFSLASVPGPDGRLAAAVAILVEITRERAYREALSRKIAQLGLLQEVSRVLARTARLDQVLGVVLAAMVHPAGLGLSSAALFLVDPRRGVLRGRMARRRPGIEGTSSFEDLGERIEALAFQQPFPEDRVLETMVRRVVVPLDRRDHPLVRALAEGSPRPFAAGGPADVIEPRLAGFLGPEPAWLVGLRGQSEGLGVLCGTLPPGPDREEDLPGLLGLLAASAAGAIQRSRLHDELAQRLEDLRVAHERTRHLQRKLLEEERLSAIGELAAEIVHQIRNPLSILGGFARRLARAIPEDDPRREDVAIIVEEASRMEMILERIRQEVRVARSPAEEAVDVAGLVADAVARYRELAAEQGIELVAEVEEGLPAVRGGREILLEVLDNLLRNAFDAVGEGGRVAVEARRLRDTVHIVVEDNGPGLSPEDIEKVFEPFYTTKAGGTGLGLPLARRLVAQCGGSLTAGGRPGEGSRFRVVLPLADAGRVKED